MDSILREIFDGEYDFTPKRDERQRKLDQRACAEWEKVQKMFGDEFVDHLLALEGEREDWRAFRYYQAGFRLGIRLVLEAFGA